MSSTVLTRARVRFGRPKWPSGAEWRDWIFGVGMAHGIVTPFMMPELYRTWELIVFTPIGVFIVVTRWRGYVGHWWWVVKLRPLEGRRERLVTGLICGAALSIGLDLVGINPTWLPLWWASLWVSWRDSKDNDPEAT